MDLIKLFTKKFIADSYSQRCVNTKDDFGFVYKGKK